MNSKTDPPSQLPASLRSACGHQPASIQFKNHHTQLGEDCFVRHVPLFAYIRYNVVRPATHLSGRYVYQDYRPPCRRSQLQLRILTYTFKCFDNDPQILNTSISRLDQNKPNNSPGKAMKTIFLFPPPVGSPTALASAPSAPWSLYVNVKCLLRLLFLPACAALH